MSNKKKERKKENVYIEIYIISVNGWYKDVKIQRLLSFLVEWSGSQHVIYIIVSLEDFCRCQPFQQVVSELVMMWGLYGACIIAISFAVGVGMVQLKWMISLF